MKRTHKNSTPILLFAAALACETGSSSPDAGGNPAGDAAPGADQGVAQDAAPGADAAAAADAAPGADAAGMDAQGGADGGVNLTCDPAALASPGCGGALNGAWTYRGACGEVAFADTLRSLCQAVQLQATSHMVTGDLSFTASTYTLSVTDVADIRAVVPAQCVPPVGGCAGLAQTLTTAGAVATCNLVGTTCDCTLRVTVAAAESGTYVASGGVITTTPTGGSAGSRYNYCVEGGTFRYREQGDDVVFVLTP